MTLDALCSAVRHRQVVARVGGSGAVPVMSWDSLTYSIVESTPTLDSMDSIENINATAFHRSIDRIMLMNEVVMMLWFDL